MSGSSLHTSVSVDYGTEGFTDWFSQFFARYVLFEQRLHQQQFHESSQNMLSHNQQWIKHFYSLFFQLSI